jgi:competence protein ComEC
LSAPAELALAVPARTSAARAFAGSVASRALVAATVGLCASAAAADWLPPQPLLLGLSIGLAIPAIVFRQVPVLLMAIAFMAGQLGAWRMQGAEAALTAAGKQVEALTGPLELRGLVADDPVNRGRTTSLRLSDVLVRAGDGWQPLKFGVRLNVPAWPEHEYGEELQVRGRLEALAGGGAIEALRRQGVLASVSYPRLSYLPNPQANPVLIALFRFRLRLGETIDQTLPEPAGSTLKATILGLRSALSKDEEQALITTGTVHLVAISGFKLSLLAAGLEAIGLWLLRRTTGRAPITFAVTVVVLTTMAGYTLMTGASPSAVRAAMMAGAALLAALVGRPREQLAALALAVFAIVLIRPFELQDGGFQLSCLSVLGIALLGEPLNPRRWIEPVPGTTQPVVAAAGRAAAVSLAATAFDLPVLAGSFHIVSLVAPLANLLGMPLLGPIMILGGLGALFGSLVPVLGALLLWPAWACVSLLEGIVRLSASLPYAALPIGELAPALVAMYYALLLAAAWWLRRKGPTRPPKPATWARRVSRIAIGAGAVAAACASAIATRPPSTLRTTFLAVPGQATLIQAPAGTKVLVDGSADGRALLRQLGAILPPWDRNIDAVVLTSTNSDHIAGLEELSARYRIGALVPPGDVPGSATLSRLLQHVPPVRVDRVDLGRGLLTRDHDGWRLQSGPDSIVLRAGGSDLQLATGSWRVIPMLRGLQPEAADGLLPLAETGAITVTFGASASVDS